MNLLPDAVDANVLDKGHRHEAGCTAAVTVAAQTCEVGWVSQVSKDAATNREGHGYAWDQVVENTTLDVGSVIGPHVNPERLFVASEVIVHEDISRQVRLCANIVGLGLVSIESEHFCHLGIDSVGCVITNGEVLWVEELSNAEVPRCGGQHVNRFDCGRVVSSPFDVDLNWQTWRCFELARNWIHPVNVPAENCGGLCVKPQFVW